MLRYALSLLIAAAALLSLAWAADVPAISDADLEQALALSGANRAQLEQALFGCQQKPFTMAAMRFLIASLPLADLGVATADELAEHVALAMQARAEFPYCGSYDDAVWAHYVLAPRVSQEPLSRWRPYFHAELQDVVKGCTTLEQAACAVNAWCGQRVRYQVTQARDQGPLITLKSGYGRCEEMVIFYIDACRAVGLPARQAYCPYWSVGDDNHAWTEVLGSDGRWHFTGGCEPAPTLDSAWFGGTVKNAPLVVSVCFGLPGEVEPRGGVAQVNESGEELLQTQATAGARVCLINSTAFYRQVGRLIVEAPGVKEGARLGVYVFNYGALRLIARVPVDGAGVAAIALGPGTYVVSLAAPEGPHAGLVRIEPAVETRLAWRDLAPLPDDVVLHFPHDPSSP